jgi:hypothetical protein
MVQTSYSATSYIYTLGSGKWAGSWNTGGHADYSYWPGEISRFYATATVLSNLEITNEFNNHKKLHILRQSNLDVLSNGSFANYSTIGTAVKKHIISDQPKLEAISTWNSFTTEAEANLSLDATLTTLSNSALSNVNDGKYLTVVDIIDGRLINYDHELILFTNRANLLLEYDPSVAIGNTVINTGSVSDMAATLENGTTLYQSNNYNYFGFDGINDQIEIEKAGDINEGNNLSVEVWINRNDKTSSQVIVGQFLFGGGSQHLAYAIRYSLAEGIYFVVGNGTVTARNYTGNNITSIPFGDWYHIVGTFSSTGLISLFVNGVLTQSNQQSVVTSAANHVRPIYIGSYNDNEFSQNFSGKIGLVRIYGATLSSAEINNNYLASRWRYLPEETQNQLTGEVMLVDGAYYETDLAIKDKSPLAATVNVVGSPVFDKFSKSFAFDGSTQYIKVNNDLDLANFTVSAWVKMSQKPAANDFYNVISDIRADSLPGQDWNYRILINSSGFAVADISDTTNRIVSDNLDIVDGKWHKITFTRNIVTEKLELFIDGRLRQSITDLSTSPTSIYDNNNEVIYIGRAAYEADHNQFRGSIGAVSIHNRAFNANEVYRNYISYNRFDDSDILVYLDATNNLSYPGTGTTWTDLSVNANNAALSNVTYSSSFDGNLDFNGVSSEGVLTSSKLNQHYYGKTIFVSAKLDAISAGDFKGLFGSDGTRKFNLYISNLSSGDSSNNGLRLHYAVSDPVLGNSGGFSNLLNYTVGDWFTAAVVHSQDNVVTYYFNGIPVGTFSTQYPFAQFFGTGADYVGRNDQRWDGPISNIQLYRRPLRAAEISQLNNQMLLNRSLVINLDAGNTASYPGTGSTWTNLVNSTQYTINNGTFDSGNGGSIVFNGTNTQVSLGTILPANSNFTKEAWINASELNANTSYNIISSANSFFFAFGTSLRAGFGSNYTQVTTTIAINNWYHVVLTFNDQANTLLLYVNGDEVSNNAIVNDSYLAQEVLIGSINNQNRWKGKISQVKIFNRPITPEEINASYNSSKARYGL